MLTEDELVRALRRHWEHSGKDEDVAHEIYHPDAVLEFPQSGERFEGVGRLLLHGLSPGRWRRWAHAGR